MNRSVQGAAMLVMLAAVLVGLVPWFASEDGEPDRLRYAIAFAAPFFAAGLLALMSERLGRPRYVMAAGLALIPISVISIVAVPLLLPALMLIVLGSRATRPGWSVEMPGSIVIIVAFVASMLSLLLHDDPRTWTTADGHRHFASDTTTGAEVAISASFLVLALLVARFVTDRDGRSGSAEDGVDDALYAGVDGEE